MSLALGSVSLLAPTTADVDGLSAATGFPAARPSTGSRSTRWAARTVDADADAAALIGIAVDLGSGQL